MTDWDQFEVRCAGRVFRGRPYMPVRYALRPAALRIGKRTPIGIGRIVQLLISVRPSGVPLASVPGAVGARAVH